MYPTSKDRPLVHEEESFGNEKIREICSKGMNINCQPEDRAFAWLNLLSIYPSNPLHFKSVCTSMMKSYQNFINYYNCTITKDRTLNLLKIQSTESSLSEKDLKLIDLIKSDINRSSSQILYLINKDGTCCKTTEEKNNFQMHVCRIERILYVFAKVNPQLSYIQGFNELLIPLYYVMHSASRLFSNDFDFIEAISYHAFEFLLISSDLRDFFKLELQSCELKLAQFDKILKSAMPKTRQVLKEINITPIQYAYRWFSIMFGQEHSLPQLLPLWDSILAHLNDLSLFEYCIGVSRIQKVADSIESHCSSPKHCSISKLVSKNYIKNDELKNNMAFGQILSILSNIQINDIYEIIKESNKIYENLRSGKKLNSKKKKSELNF